MCDSKVVEIERSVGGSFGFSVIGGVDTALPPMVCALVHNGSAQLSGKVHVGDILVEVNDECVSPLPTRKVVESLRLSPDTLKLRLRNDPAVVARARPYLRRYSVEDPKLQQFQTKFRRCASLPSRARRPVVRTRSDARPLKPTAPVDMSRGTIRVVGQETSPTGIDKGADGTFRWRLSVRSGSFSKVLTSFPAHGGPPRTVENTDRAHAQHVVRKSSLARTESEASCAGAKKGPLQSSSLPEIALSGVKVRESSTLGAWNRSSSAGDGIRRRGSLGPAIDRTNHVVANPFNETTSKDSTYGSLSQGRSQENNLTISMDSSPYLFRKPLNNSSGTSRKLTHSHSDSWTTVKERNRKDEVNKTNQGRSAGTKESAPSCDELARRLFHLEGYDRNEVAPVLFKNDDFAKKLCVVFMKYFDFRDCDLVESLRMLLDKFNLIGETQERERILIAFSNRYYECNQPEYGSADAVHTLVCAIMLLNTDLHGEQTVGNRMRPTQFMRNLSGLCDGKDFPQDLLKSIYASIKSSPLQFHAGDNQLNGDVDIMNDSLKNGEESSRGDSVGSLALMGYQATDDDVVYREGLVYRKLIEDSGGKKVSAWKRGWQPFYATLRGMILFLHKPEESRSYEDTRFSLGVHHSFASPAFDYTKRPAVFRYITADWKVLLFQARDKSDMSGWVEGLNLVAASYSAPPLPAAVGSSKRFQKPVLPFSRTRLTLTEQLASHEAKAQEMADVLIDHLNRQPHGGETRREMFEWLEKRDFYDYEYKRYRSYANILKSSKLKAQVRERGPRPLLEMEQTKRNGVLSHNLRRYNSLNDVLDASGAPLETNTNYRESYFMAIYKG